MSEVSKEYDFKRVEDKWVHSWDMSMYYFDWEDKGPQYIIDTPPPYPTGNFHIGNALNWCYIDFVARYKRMRGFNVMFPQGWDCHGLPTEVKVEEKHHITKNAVPREEFRKFCEEMTAEAIARFRVTMGKLGASIDWSNEYVTMEPRYYVKTQRSFVQLYNKGLIYRENHPVNWCPRCETAIASAEVEYDSRETSLNYMKFPAGDGYIEIATSRPELLAACVGVAVNSEDERYRDLIGKEVTVPLFDYPVKVISDPAVDTKFGSGIVMICTFGDRQDVKWWIEHKLPLKQAIDRNGHLTEEAGAFSGLSVQEAKKAIIGEMKDKGIIFREEPLAQNVGLCWRCKTPIEILSERQWFVRIDKRKILDKSSEIEWVPPHMEVRLKNWTESMEWDWCISRQRIFATPIPVWYCKECGEPLVAREEWLPLDPTRVSPPIACKCGCGDFEPEEDVLDTWMDSSVSALAVSGWHSNHEPRYPTQLRPQGHDIIRTWAFYTILRTEALVGTRPWDAILVNGMVLGEDGRKMSKSLGNFIIPEEVFEKYGADALRQWAALGGSPGSDVMFQWKEIVAASRFQQKLWSIFRFSGPHMAPTGEAPGQVDRWLLGELDALIARVTDAMDRYQFDEAFRALRVFTWETLADNYIELVKARLYGADGQEKRAAENALYTAIDALVRMMAPFIPFITEEIYRTMTGVSIHSREWPKPQGVEVDAAGLEIKEIAAAIRRYKSERGMALNSSLPGIAVYSDRNLETTDLQGVANSPVQSKTGRPEIETRPVSVKPVSKVLGPALRGNSGKVINALSSMNPEDVASMVEAGSVKVHLDGETFEIPQGGVEIVTETLSAGTAVDLLKVGEATVLIKR